MNHLLCGYSIQNKWSHGGMAPFERKEDTSDLDTNNTITYSKNVNLYIVYFSMEYDLNILG